MTQPTVMIDEACDLVTAALAERLSVVDGERSELHDAIKAIRELKNVALQRDLMDKLDKQVARSAE